MTIKLVARILDFKLKKIGICGNAIIKKCYPLHFHFFTVKNRDICAKIVGEYVYKRLNQLS